MRDLLVPDRNSSWPCVGSSGPLHVVASSVIIACSSATGAWTSSASVPALGEVVDLFLGERVAQVVLLLVLTNEPASRRRGGGWRRPRRGRALPGAAPGRSGTGRRRRAPRSIAGAISSAVSTRTAATPIACGQLVEVDVRVAEVERRREGVLGDAPLLPVLLRCSASAAGSCGCCRPRTWRRSSWRAAVHSAWIVYMLPPSPVKPITVLSGLASLTPMAPGNADAERAAAGQEVVPGQRRRQVAGQLGRGGQRLVEDDRRRRAAWRASSAMNVDGVQRQRRRRTSASRASRAASSLALRLAERRPVRARRPRAARRVSVALERVGERGRASSFGSATRPEVDREVLGDLVGVEVDVDDLRAGREDALERGEDLGEDVGADDQHRVGLRR